jgi:hypothetical protein
MFEFDMPRTEDFTRVAAIGGTKRSVVQQVSDANDNRFTFRMQYKF